MWTVDPPDSWAPAPANFTFSLVESVRRCPRKWAYSRALFPAVWDKTGYPQKLNRSAVIGRAIHASVQAIIDRLILRGCKTLSDESASQELRDMGGISAVIRDQINQAFEIQRGNPRAASLIDYEKARIEPELVRVRNIVKNLISGIRLTGEPPPHGSGKPSSRGALRPGTYCELTIKNTQLNWSARVDVLSIDSTGCEIVELKSGEFREEHARQLRTYEVLWLSDAELNPSRRPATSLLLIYPNKVVSLPVSTDAELAAKIEEIKSESARVSKDLSDMPPTAQPSAENCSTCDFRHLCDQYWSSSAPLGNNGMYADVEVLVSKKIGGRHLFVNVERSSKPSVSGELLVSVGNDSLLDPGALRIGQRFRLLDCSVHRDAEDRLTLHLGHFSEAFLIR